jgi:TRAP-type C4-dicarboxylate transport system, large permease component
MRSAAGSRSLHVSRFGFLLIINLMFLVLGCFLDTLLMLLVIVPIVMPSITGLGIDKVHFGVTTIVNLMIGMITRPIASCSSSSPGSRASR